MDKKQLEIGDTVYRFYQTRVTGIETIVSFKGKKAVSNTGAEFKKELTSYGAVEYINRSTGYSFISYSLETPELKEKYFLEVETTKCLNIIDKVVFKELTLSQLKAISDIITQPTL